MLFHTFNGDSNGTIVFSGNFQIKYTAFSTSHTKAKAFMGLQIEFYIRDYFDKFFNDRKENSIFGEIADHQLIRLHKFFWHDWQKAYEPWCVKTWGRSDTIVFGRKFILKKNNSPVVKINPSNLKMNI